MCASHAAPQHEGPSTKCHSRQAVLYTHFFFCYAHFNNILLSYDHSFFFSEFFWLVQICSCIPHATLVIVSTSNELFAVQKTIDCGAMINYTISSQMFL